MEIILILMHKPKLCKIDSLDKLRAQINNNHFEVHVLGSYPRAEYMKISTHKIDY